jgi:hypothetical protein
VIRHNLATAVVAAVAAPHICGVCPSGIVKTFFLEALGQLAVE